MCIVFFFCRQIGVNLFSTGREKWVIFGSLFLHKLSILFEIFRYLSIPIPLLFRYLRIGHFGNTQRTWWALKYDALFFSATHIYLCFRIPSPTKTRNKICFEDLSKALTPNYHNMSIFGKLLLLMILEMFCVPVLMWKWKFTKNP